MTKKIIDWLQQNIQQRPDSFYSGVVFGLITIVTLFLVFKFGIIFVLSGLVAAWLYTLWRA